MSFYIRDGWSILDTRLRPWLWYDMSEMYDCCSVLNWKHLTKRSCGLCKLLDTWCNPCSWTIVHCSHGREHTFCPQTYSRKTENRFRKGLPKKVSAPGWSGWMQHIQGWRSRTVGILQSLKVCRVLIIAMFTIDQRKCGLPQLRCLDSAGIYHQPQASRAYPSASSVCTNSSTCPANNVPCPLPKPSVGNGYTHQSSGTLVL